MKITHPKTLFVIGISLILIGSIVGLMQNCEGVKLTAPSQPKLTLTTEWRTHKVPLGNNFEAYPVEEGTFLEMRPIGQDKLTVTIDNNGTMRRNGKIVERLEMRIHYVDIRSKPEFAGKEYVFLLKGGN